jgi:hypothetical protein
MRLGESKRNVSASDAQREAYWEWDLDLISVVFLLHFIYFYLNFLAN